jgi:hypothetical protein
VADKDVDLNAERDNWYLDQSTTTITNYASLLPADDSIDALKKRLEDDRRILEELKHEYWKLRRSKKSEKVDADREIRAYMSDMMRYVLAIETIKDRIASKAERFPFSQYDREHPNAAARRLESASKSSDSTSWSEIGYAVLIVVVIIVLFLLLRPH